MSDDYDLCVIGGGSAGTRAARIAAGRGARVIIAEEYRLGGTCVIRGCVPKKLLVLAGRIGIATACANDWGWRTAPALLDWPALVNRVQSEVTRLEGRYRQGLLEAGAEIVDTRAVFLDAHTIMLGDNERRIRARKVLVATGGRPLRLPQHADVGMTSNEIFTRAELPRRLVVAGAGYIAVEFAGVFAALGCDVTMVCRGEGLLTGFDRDLRAAVAGTYARRNIALLFQDTIADITRRGSELQVKTVAGADICADEIIWAFGRKPNTTNIGLEAAGVAVDPLGAIVVDAHSRSTVENIYAAGDVTNRANLTPVAIREGHAFADSLFGDVQRRLDYSLIPTAVFSTPEIAAIGLSEDEAQRKLISFDVYQLQLGRRSESAEQSFIKIIVDVDTDKVVGVHAFADHASEIVQGLAVAISAGLTRQAIQELELMSSDLDWVRLSSAPIRTIDRRAS